MDLQVGKPLLYSIEAMGLECFAERIRLHLLGVPRFSL